MLSTAQRAARTARWLAWVLVALAGAATVHAQPPAAHEEGVRWRELTSQQRAALAPLEREWPAIEASRKKKWLEIAGRYPSLAPAEQSRVQARMSEWARMTPTERGQARLNFQQARQVPSADRQARWEAYQALSADQRRQLAARAVPPAASTPTKRHAGVEGPQPKSNIVPNPALAAPPRPVAPTVVQAKPGATTTLISDRRTPPPHQQTGMPKIAATPGFVDRSTLLPQRGPRGTTAADAPPRDNPPRREQ
jgi:hypothetical protein